MNGGREIIKMGEPPGNDFSMRISDCGFGISDCGFEIADLGLRNADLGLRISDCGFEIAQERPRQKGCWKLKVDSYFTQISTLQSDTLQSEI